VAINCDQTRSQSQNKELALKRLTELVNLSLQPIKVRRPTKPTATAKRQRLQTKKHRGQIKRNRQIKTTDLD
jgi:ribosome-associated protein